MTNSNVSSFGGVWIQRLLGRLCAKPKERLGHWSDRKVQTYTALAASIPGDFAEIGVAYGRTFKRLIPIAQTQGKIAHAFDSFEGMSKPGKFDRQQGGHSEGKFNVGGVERFRTLLDKAGLPRVAYRLWPGFIPECFQTYTGKKQFSFAIIDVDHYEPTRQALIWLWPLVSVGGVVMVDDYGAGWKMESSLAVIEFLGAHKGIETLEVSNNQITMRKTASSTP